MANLSNLALAADSHNLMNVGASWDEPKSWEDRIGNAGKFMATSLISGANSFYNSAAAVGSWLGADIEQNDTQAAISSIDRDWGIYYEANKELVDITGFVVGSLIPGLGGAKLFNMGQNVLRGSIQSGKISGNLARATGLLVTNKSAYLDASKDLITKSLATASIQNRNTTLALASGVYQNVLEAAAAEIMITATMFKSPVLDDMETADIAKNIVTGALFGGVVGGALDAAKSIGFLRKAADAEDIARLPWLRRTEVSAATPAGDKAIQIADDMEKLAVPVKLTATDPIEAARLSAEFDKNMKLYNGRITKDLNAIRTNMHTLAGSHTDLGNQLADLSSPIRNDRGLPTPGFAQNLYENLTGAIHIAPVTVTTKAEAAAVKLAKRGEVNPNPVAVKYVKLSGSAVGDILDEAPKVLSLGDIYPTQKHLMSAVSSEKFSVKKLFDMRKLTTQKGYLEAQRRYVWAVHSDMLAKGIPDGAQIHATDIPLLTRALNDGQLNINIVQGEGPTLDVFTPATREELYAHVKKTKIDLANELHLAGYKQGVDSDISADKAAIIADIKRSYLEGTQGADELRDIFASADAGAAQAELLAARGLSSSELPHPIFRPTVAKVVYGINQNLLKEHEHIADAIVALKAQEKVFVESAKRVTARNLGDAFNQLPEFVESALNKLNRRGAGAGLLTGANAGYGTPGELAAQIGKVTAGVRQAKAKEIKEALEPALYRLTQNPAAAIEFESINQRVARSELLFTPYTDDSGVRYLVDRNVSKAVEAGGGETLIDDLLTKDNHIPIASDDAWQAVLTHVELGSKRVVTRNEITAAYGKTNNRFEGVFDPIRPSPSEYPFFAFVTDPRVTNSGHTAMIHAASEKELAELIDKVPEHFKVSASKDLAAKINVRTKLDVEDYYKARNEYEFQRTLHDNYINGELKRKGVYSNYFPKTDPRVIANGVLQQHLREESTQVRELIRLHYEPQFAMIESIGDDYSRYATSRFAAKSEQVKQTTNNPYYNIIKTALDISNLNEHHLVHGFNKLLDEAVSKAYAATAKVWRGVKSPEDLDKINKLLDTQGMKPAYYDAALEALANHTAPRGVLTQFIRKANSMLSLFTLGLDPLNAVNNAIGSNILRMTELSSVTKAIKGGNIELAGELAQLAKITTPGTNDSILAPTKLVAKAIDNLFRDGKVLGQRYKDMGLIKDRVEQLHMLMDDFTLKGTESVGELSARTDTAFARIKSQLGAAGEFGEKWSANKFVEEANRFISANVMDQITGLAIKHGIMDEKTAVAYINTFVNRVEGTIMASQRPLIFQGPIGQAVGLFQRYQFNLLQQMFRYVSEGSKKDVAMLFGLQSTLYGIQGLPAFQFINTNLIGQASGNTERKDLYDYTYGVAGTKAADWLMYGIPSNMLQTNIYTRGDINPRHLTIIPTSIQDTPLVQGWGKLLLSLKETVNKVGGGGDAWESILQGVEHNGISRPLAGFAQVFQATGSNGQVYSTSNRGSILYSNDLVSLATVTRLAGGRPLEEARLNDSLHRIRVYQAANREKMLALGETVKTTLIQGNEPSEAAVESFASKYAAFGGKQEGFNRWMLNLYKDANVSQAEQLEMDLKNPFNQKMQLLMGGDTPDGAN